MVCLHEAVRSGKVTEVCKVLESDASLVNKRNQEGQTPLHVAVLHGHLEIIQHLLKYGARPNSKDRKKWTPLHMCAKQDQLDIAALLLEGGADLKRQNCRGMIPFMVACKHGNVSMATFLLQKGSPVQVVSMFQRTPLHWAIKAKNADLVKLVLEQRDDLNCIDTWDKTPLFEAVRCNAPDILAVLHARGAKNFAQPDRYGCQPIHYAASKGYMECIKFLLKCGVLVDSKMRNGTTPLMLAAANARSEVLKLLLSHGADVNAVDKSGSNALHRLLAEKKIPRHGNDLGVPEYHWLRSVLALVRSNVDFGATTKRQLFYDVHRLPFYSPLDIAVKANMLEMTQFLCYAGAPRPSVLPDEFGGETTEEAFKAGTEALKWVQQYFSGPRSLRYLCRHVVRQHCGSRSAIDSLKVPPAIKSLLQFVDLENFIAQFGEDDEEKEAEIVSSEDEYEPSDYDSDLYGQRTPVNTDDELCDGQ